MPLSLPPPFPMNSPPPFLLPANPVMLWTPPIRSTNPLPPPSLHPTMTTALMAVWLEGKCHANSKVLCIFPRMHVQQLNQKVYLEAWGCVGGVVCLEQLLMYKCTLMLYNCCFYHIFFFYVCMCEGMCRCLCSAWVFWYQLSFGTCKSIRVEQKRQQGITI